jgi:prophage tail gpP-like protein
MTDRAILRDIVASGDQDITNTPIYTPLPAVLDRLSVVVGNQAVSGWTSYNISSDCFGVVDTFSCSIWDLSTAVVQGLTPGSRYQLILSKRDGNVIDGEPLQTGTIHSLDDSIQTDRSFSTSVGGQNLLRDLQSSSVPRDVIVGGRTVLDVVSELADVYDIHVTVNNRVRHQQRRAEYDVKVNEIIRSMDTDALRRKHKPSNEESIYDFLNRLVAEYPVNIHVNAYGDLIVAPPSYGQAPSYVFNISIDRPSVNNVLATDVRINIDGMPTEIVKESWRRKRDADGELMPREKISVNARSKVLVTEHNTSGHAYLVVPKTYYRPLISYDPKAKTDSRLKSAANTALDVQSSGWLTIDVTVDGHDQGGVPYRVDTVAHYRNERLGIAGDFYVRACQYFRQSRSANEGAAYTQISLEPLYGWVKP